MYTEVAHLPDVNKPVFRYQHTLDALLDTSSTKRYLRADVSSAILIFKHDKIQVIESTSRLHPGVACNSTILTPCKRSDAHHSRTIIQYVHSGTSLSVLVGSSTRRRELGVLGRRRILKS